MEGTRSVGALACKAMRRRLPLLLGFVSITAVLAFDQDDKVARGKYLAEEVAQCQGCHTPKMDNGSFIKSMWMKGATLNVAPAAPVQGWHSAAPDITPNGALWKRWNDE